MDPMHLVRDLDAEIASPYRITSAVVAPDRIILEVRDMTPDPYGWGRYPRTKAVAHDVTIGADMVAVPTRSSGGAGKRLVAAVQTALAAVLARVEAA